MRDPSFATDRVQNRRIVEISRPTASKVERFGDQIRGGKPERPTGFLERAMGIEIIAAWLFKDLGCRARTDLEGLGSVRNPYCRLDVALLP